jgi:hypothetical protein
MGGAPVQAARPCRAAWWYAVGVGGGFLHVPQWHAGP